MKSRKYIIVAIYLLFTAVYGYSNTKKIVVVPLNVAGNEQVLKLMADKYLDELNSILNKDGNYQPVPKRSIKRTVNIIKQQNWDIAKKRGMAAIGNLLKSDMVVAGEIAYNSADNKIIVNISIMDAKTQQVIQQFVINEPAANFNIILGNIVNKAYASLNNHYNRSGNSGFTETATVITSTSSVSSKSAASQNTASSSSPAVVKPKKNNDKNMTFNTVFNYKMVLPVFDQELEKILGIDFVFDIERTYYAFGFGIELQGSNLANILPFFEMHFMENDYYRNWQGYMRLSTGINYPLNSSAEFDFSFRTSVGVRFTASYFNFDIGVALNYFRSQTSSIMLGFGGGFHF